MGRAKGDLAELVAFQSVADPKQYPPEECEKAAQWVVDAFTEVGLQDVTASPTPDGSKAVHGHAPGPDGTPTVLLYCHYDVQPPLGEDAWTSPVWELTERDGRWYGRGAADCKGNIVMHLTALRALKQVSGGFPCGVKLICEGSEEQGTGGLEAFVPPNADLLRADTILVVDTGNFAVGVPTLTTTLRGMTSVDVTVRALGSAMHSGMFGGPAPDPVVGLIQMLATLHDEHGNTTVDGLDATQTWTGVEYSAEQFRGRRHRARRRRADGRRQRRRPAVGAPVGDRARDRRPAGDRLVVRRPGVGRRARQPAAAAGHDRQGRAGRARRAPASRASRGACSCEIERVAVGDPFVGALDGPGVRGDEGARWRRRSGGR